MQDMPKKRAPATNVPQSPLFDSKLALSAPKRAISVIFWSSAISSHVATLISAKRPSSRGRRRSTNIFASCPPRLALGDMLGHKSLGFLHPDSRPGGLVHTLDRPRLFGNHLVVCPVSLLRNLVAETPLPRKCLGSSQSTFRKLRHLCIDCYFTDVRDRFWR